MESSKSLTEFMSFTQVLEDRRRRLNEMRAECKTLSDWDAVKVQEEALLAVEVFAPTFAGIPMQALLFLTSLEVMFRPKITCDEHHCLMEQMRMVQDAVALAGFRHVVQSHVEDSSASGQELLEDAPSFARVQIEWALKMEGKL
jgi:hypothetical protein